jgi:hypothetical protein
VTFFLGVSYSEMTWREPLRLVVGKGSAMAMTRRAILIFIVAFAFLVMHKGLTGAAPKPTEDYEMPQLGALCKSPVICSLRNTTATSLTGIPWQPMSTMKRHELEK